MICSFLQTGNCIASSLSGKFRNIILTRWLGNSQSLANLLLWITTFGCPSLLNLIWQGKDRENFVTMLISPAPAKNSLHVMNTSRSGHRFNSSIKMSAGRKPWPVWNIPVHWHHTLHGRYNEWEPFFFICSEKKAPERVTQQGQPSFVQNRLEVTTWSQSLPSWCHEWITPYVLWPTTALMTRHHSSDYIHTVAILLKLIECVNMVN